MKTNKTKPVFTLDCIAVKRQIQERIYEQTKHMTAREELDYYKARASEGSLSKWWKKTGGAAQRRRGSDARS